MHNRTGWMCSWLAPKLHLDISEYQWVHKTGFEENPTEPEFERLQKEYNKAVVKARSQPVWSFQPAKGLGSRKGINLGCIT